MILTNELINWDEKQLMKTLSLQKKYNVNIFFEEKVFQIMYWKMLWNQSAFDILHFRECCTKVSLKINFKCIKIGFSQDAKIPYYNYHKDEIMNNDVLRKITSKENVKCLSTIYLKILIKNHIIYKLFKNLIWASTINALSRHSLNLLFLLLKMDIKAKLMFFVKMQKRPV